MGWVRFLVTDAEVVGFVAWIGLTATIGGFVIALAQLRKVKTASESARDAVARLSMIVRSQEQTTKITDSLGHLRMAQAMVKHGNAEAAAAYLSVSWSMLTAARELEADLTNRGFIDGCIIGTKKLRDDLGSPSPKKGDPVRAMNQRYAQIGEIVDILATMSARLHMRLSEIGTQP